MNDLLRTHSANKGKIKVLPSYLFHLYKNFFSAFENSRGCVGGLNLHEKCIEWEPAKSGAKNKAQLVSRGMLGDAWAANRGKLGAK